MRMLGSVITGLLALSSASYGQSDAAPADLARYFGFDQMEIYKLKYRIGLLRLADANGDGRKDVVLWNGDRSRIELFYQPDPNAPVAAPAAELERNELPNRGALRNEGIPVAYSVASLDVGDFTGDQRPDIVFFGEPREVVILPGLTEGGFGAPITQRAPEGQPGNASMATGDFDGDGRSDVALLGENMLLLFSQRAEGGLAKPRRLVHNIPQTLLLLPADLNGDGLTDLIGTTDDREFGAFVFLQEAGGALGPAQRIAIPTLRSLTIGPRKDGDDVFAVEAATGRLKLLRWQKSPQAAVAGDWPQFLYSYPVASKAKQRPVAIGDVTGDGAPDLVAIDPDAAQMILFAGSAQGLRAGEAFPCVAKTVEVTIGDVDGDGRNEVVTVSPDERMLGVSRYENGRLTFPTPLKDAEERQAKPLAAESGTLRKEGDALAYVAVVKPAEGDEKTQLIVLQAGHEPLQIDVGKLKDEPGGLRFVDANQDGRQDLLLFVRFSAPVVLLQTADGGFERFDGAGVRSELIKEAGVSGFDAADVDGDGKAELLLASKNAARALAIRDGRWTIVDQFSTESTDAEITGVAAMPGAGSADRPQLLLYNRRGRELTLLSAAGGKGYRVERTMPVGEYDLQLMQAAPLGADAAPMLVMADTRRVTLLRPGGDNATLVEQQSYETDIRDAFLGDSVVGDLNGDGVRDVLAVDQRRAHLEVLTTLPSGKLAKAMHFQVFQGKRFSGEPDRGGEPREVLMADLNGDGRDDVALLVHDRLIVYPSQ